MTRLPTSVSGSELRHAMRRLPSPVTVVTSAWDDQIRGITIGSFTSVSLEPALVSLNLSTETPFLEMVRRSFRFVVHFLREDQAHLSETFAIPNLSGSDQFAAVNYELDEDGLPVMGDVLGRLYCFVEGIHPAGDHFLVVGRVYRVDELQDGDPLVYYDRGYHSVGDVVDVPAGSNPTKSSTGTS